MKGNFKEQRIEVSQNCKIEAMEKKNYSKEFRRAAMPIFISNWIFGMGIIEIPLGRPRRILSIIYITSILGIYTFASIYSFPYVKEFGRHIAANSIIAKAFFGSNVFLTISSILLGYRRTEGMHLILQQVLTADESLQKIGIEQNYMKVAKSQLRQVLIYLFTIVIATLIVNFFLVRGEVLTTRKVTFLVVLDFPIIVLALIDATFFNILQYSRFKLRKLNDLLKENLTTTCNSPQYSNVLKYYKVNLTTQLNLMGSSFSTYKRNSEMYYTLKMARWYHANDQLFWIGHLNFTLFCKTTSKVYAFHILISMVVAILLLTGCFYHSYAILKYGNASLNYQYIFPLMSSIIIYNATKIYLFAKYCNDVSQESIVTGSIISEIYDENISEDSKNEIQKFETQLIDYPLNILVFGVELNYSLIQKLIQTITTNVVILTNCGNVSLELPEK